LALLQGFQSRNLATPKELLPDEVLFKRIQGRM